MTHLTVPNDVESLDALLPGLATPDELRIAPTLGGCVDGVICDDPWTVACRDCGRTGTGKHVLLAILDGDDCRFHIGGWPDGTNPRLCRACRLARGCDCRLCRKERDEARRCTRRKET